MEAKIWLTGFVPFGNHTFNPSQEIAEALIGTTHSVEIEPAEPFGLQSTSVQLHFEGSILSVDEAGSSDSLSHFDGIDAVIHLGLKETADRIHLEMCAVNECDFRIADNSGRQLRESPVEPTGLSLLHSTAHRPSFEIAYGDTSAVVISEDAGRFVCNETYFRTLYSIESQGLNLPAMFIHIPAFDNIDAERQIEIILEVAARLAQKPTMSVVGGVVVNAEGKMLACKRAASEAMGGWWEFPGGKIEAGETAEIALEREMKEELGLDVKVGPCLGHHDHDYGSMIVKLAFHLCKAPGQEPKLSVHDESRWITESEIKTIEWLPPDVAFVEELAERGFAALVDQS